MNTYNSHLISDTWGDVAHITLIPIDDNISTLYKINNTIDMYNGYGAKLPYKFTINEQNILNTFECLSCNKIHTNNSDDSHTVLANNYINNTQININNLSCNTSHNLYKFNNTEILTHGTSFTDGTPVNGLDRMCATYNYLNMCDMNKDSVYATAISDLKRNNHVIDTIVYKHSTSNNCKLTIPANTSITILACCNVSTHVTESHNNDVTGEVTTNLLVNNGTTNTTIDEIKTRISGIGKEQLQTTGGCDKRYEAFTQKIYGTKNILLFGTYTNESGNNKDITITITSNAKVDNVGILVLNGEQFNVEV